MRVIYELDGNSIYTGKSREIDEKEGRPVGWVQSADAPPEGIAKWQGGTGWEGLEEYPAPAPIDPKLAGVEILGVMCSATRDDQNGLSAVALGVTIARAGSQTFPNTRFEFENGNTLVITDANFDTIYAAWMPFRQSFFAAE